MKLSELAAGRCAPPAVTQMMVCSVCLCLLQGNKVYWPTTAMCVRQALNHSPACLLVLYIVLSTRGSVADIARQRTNRTAYVIVLQEQPATGQALAHDGHLSITNICLTQRQSTNINMPLSLGTTHQAQHLCTIAYVRSMVYFILYVWQTVLCACNSNVTWLPRRKFVNVTSSA